MKQKKGTKPLTKKRVFSFILLTILLGTFAYMLGCFLTKSILNLKTKQQKINFSDLTNIDTIEPITFSLFLKRYNELLEDTNLNKYKIQEEEMEQINKGKQITFSDFKLIFQIDNDRLEISALSYSQESDEIKQLVEIMMLANQPNMSQEDASLLYDKIWETKEYNQQEEEYTSQFYQYLGLEASLKTKIGNDYLYQFRIGRIMD